MIVGLVGFAGSGKDTAGKIISDLYNFRKISFASKLKDVVSILFNWSRHLLEGDTEESRIFRETPDKFWSSIFHRDVTPRYMLQYFGTDICRNHLYLNIWVDSLLYGISDTENVVISDVRFVNEIEAIKKRNGLIVRIKRNNDPIWFDELKKACDNARDRLISKIGRHESELDWIRYGVWHHQLDNDGDILMLKNKIIDLMKINRSKNEI